ncbi:dihydrofolate reductase-like [Haliotis cracherodii]|uniref:dihydrofolate reductase-like n=1 Tax=Haliotis cracherodii TaxID=6455 RepID=UPI0039E75502
MRYRPPLTMSKEMKIMVAMCDGNRGIGNNGRLPWPHLKEDFDYYLNEVKHRHNPEKKNVHIQGRGTWRAVGSTRTSDPNQIQIVISRTLDGSKGPLKPIVVPTLEEAVLVATSPEIQSQIESIWIIGGERVYEAAIAHPLCKRIYLTRIYKDFVSDVFFPPFEDRFAESSDPDVDGKMREDNGIAFRFEVYDRKC